LLATDGSAAADDDHPPPRITADTSDEIDCDDREEVNTSGAQAYACFNKDYSEESS
jgi:hypothetical protein